MNTLTITSGINIVIIIQRRRQVDMNGVAIYKGRAKCAVFLGQSSLIFMIGRIPI